MKNPLFLAFLLALTNCTEPKVVDPVYAEIDALEAGEAHWKYLEQLFQDDQELRQGQSSQLMLQYGKESPEFQAFQEQFNARDALNLKKTEYYLKQYGYPTVEEVGELAAAAMWAVIHHADDLDARRRNFPALYKAYQDGAIDDAAFSMYLNRTYEQQFGERLTLEGSFREEQRIDTLIRALKLPDNQK